MFYLYVLTQVFEHWLKMEFSFNLYALIMKYKFFYWKKVHDIHGQDVLLL